MTLQRQSAVEFNLKFEDFSGLYVYLCEMATYVSKLVVPYAVLDAMGGSTTNEFALVT